LNGANALSLILEVDPFSLLYPKKEQKWPTAYNNPVTPKESGVFYNVMISGWKTGKSGPFFAKQKIGNEY